MADMAMEAMVDTSLTRAIRATAMEAITEATDRWDTVCTAVMATDRTNPTTEVMVTDLTLSHTSEAMATPLISLTMAAMDTAATESVAMDTVWATPTSRNRWSPK